MRVEKISYQKVFPLGMYVNEKVGIEIGLDDGDDKNEVFAFAKSCVEKWGTKLDFGSANGETLAWPMSPHFPPLATTPMERTPTPVINIQTERLKDLMSDCENLEQLANFKEEATKAGLQNEYMNKLKQFV